jgi:hypothetical protein
MAKAGDNLTSYPNLEFFTGSSPEDLEKQFKQIRLPFQIVAIYAQGGNHVAWLSLAKPIRKKKVKKDSLVKGIKKF